MSAPSWSGRCSGGATWIGQNGKRTPQRRSRGTLHCRYDEVRAQLALAHTQLRRADAAALARAEQALVGAQTVIDEIGARAFEAELHECRAHLAQRRGDAPAARREIEESRRLYVGMGATARAERLATEIGI
jgi:hypothetical protein